MIHDCDCHILQPSLKISSRLKFFPFKKKKKVVKTVIDWIINTAAGGERGRGGKWGESNVNQQPDSVIPTLNRWREKNIFCTKYFTNLKAPHLQKNGK